MSTLREKVVPNPRVRPEILGPYSKYNPYVVHETEAQEMVKLYKEGYSFADISGITGWSCRTVANHIAARGVRTRSREEQKAAERGAALGYTHEIHKPCFYCGTPHSAPRRKGKMRWRWRYCSKKCYKKSSLQPRIHPRREADGHWWVDCPWEKGRRVRLEEWIWYRETGQELGGNEVLVMVDGFLGDCRLDNLRVMRKEDAASYYSALTPVR